MSRFLRLAFAIPLTHAAACSAFESGDPERSGESDAGSAELDGSRSRSDASAPSSSGSTTDGAPSSADAGTEVSLLNGDFELGCTAWTVIGETADSDIARSGGKACRVCIPSNSGFASISQKVSVPVPVGSSFAAEIWYRADPSQPASKGPVALIHTFAGGPLATEEGPTSTGQNPSADWAKVIALIAPMKEASALDFELTLQADSGMCILVDDARIVRTR